MRTKLNLILVSAVLSSLILTACKGREDGTLEGSIMPPDISVRIAALRNGAAISTIDTASKDGRFSMQLPAGTYDISVTVPSSPFPMTFAGVVVEPKKITTLPPIILPSATETIVGKIEGPTSGAKVTLLYDGVERATINPDADGRYEFQGLPPGKYSLHVSAPGYAADTRDVELSEGRPLVQNIRLLYISETPGIDWQAGKIRAVGLGLPPRKSPNASVSREMAKRAALADGLRNLLAIIEQVKVSPDKSVKSISADKGARIRIQGFVQGCKVISERETGDGKFELVLELPLTGAEGLSSVISEGAL